MFTPPVTDFIFDSISDLDFSVATFIADEIKSSSISISSEDTAEGFSGLIASAVNLIDLNWPLPSQITLTEPLPAEPFSLQAVHMWQRKPKGQQPNLKKTFSYQYFLIFLPDNTQRYSIYTCPHYPKQGKFIPIPIFENAVFQFSKTFQTFYFLSFIFLRRKILLPADTVACSAGLIFFLSITQCRENSPKG